MARQTEEAYIKGLKQGYALARAQYCSIVKSQSTSELIRHTKSLAKIAKENNDNISERFYLGVIEYLDEYLQIFSKE